MVFYLKYRPQQIKDLDNQDVRQKLESVLTDVSSIPHAFLFTGPKGLGKTSAARIIAKSINCQKKGKNSIEPCNKCDSCISITSGTNMDIVEIDAASNRGIDEIRDLREKVRLAPVSEKKKVYIIDEVHMLTTEAFNALLKTLEEPPSHVVFILCTTEPHKVPSTVISRCLHISFNKATTQELVRSFERIIKGEGITADKATLENIALFADGSFRDGSKILEEVSKQSKIKKITPQIIEDRFKTTTVTSELDNLLNSLITKDTKGAIKAISVIEKAGIDIKFFMDQLINKLHDLLLRKVKNEKEIGLSIKDLTRLIDLVSTAYSQIKYSALPQLPLEIAIVEWGLSDDKSQSEPVETESKNVVVSKPQSENDRILMSLIDRVKADNFAVAGVLRGCTIEKLDKKLLVIATMYKFHKEKLEDKTVHQLIQSKVDEILGKNVKVSFLLKSVRG